MKAHPNVLARVPSGRDQFNFKSTGPALPCSPRDSVCLDPSPSLLALGGTALDRAAPFARVGDCFIVFVKPRERVWSWSFVSTRRFVQLYLSFFPSTWDILASALSLPSLLLLTFPVYFQVSSHSFYQRSLLSLPPTPLPPLTPLPWSPSTHLSSLPTSPTSLSQPHFSCV